MYINNDSDNFMRSSNEVRIRYLETRLLLPRIPMRLPMRSHLRDEADKRLLLTRLNVRSRGRRSDDKRKKSA